MQLEYDYIEYNIFMMANTNALIIIGVILLLVSTQII